MAALGLIKMLKSLCPACFLCIVAVTVECMEFNPKRSEPFDETCLVDGTTERPAAMQEHITSTFKNLRSHLFFFIQRVLSHCFCQDGESLLTDLLLGELLVFQLSQLDGRQGKQRLTHKWGLIDAPLAAKKSSTHWTPPLFTRTTAVVGFLRLGSSSSVPVRTAKILWAMKMKVLCHCEGV